AAALSVALAVMGIALVAAERRLRGARVRQGSIVASRAPLVPVPLGGFAWLAHGALGLVAAASVGLPIVALLRYLGVRSSQGTSASAADVLRDAAATLGLGMAGAAVALALALPIGLLAARYRSRLSGVIESVSYI